MSLLGPPPSPSMRERIETLLGRGLAALPAPVARRLAGEARVIEGRTLDPHVQLLLEIHARVKNKNFEVPLAQARRAMEVTANQLSEARAHAVSTEDRVIGGRPARVYRSSSLGQPTTGLVYFHGGGFVMGSPHSHDAPCRRMAERLQGIVISIDYRLAPEHPFPAAADDATATALAVLRNASEFGIDPHRVVLGGDSAGGGLSIVASLEAFDAGLRPAATLAIYPAVDFTMSMPSHETLGKGFFLEHEDILFYRRNYLQGADEKHPRASPYFRTDLQRMPPTVVVTAGFDPLRDEGDRFADKLADAGVRVQHLSFPEMFHGFWNTSAIPGARRAFDLTMDALEHLLAPEHP